MNLVIVESPTKAKTLSGFLGASYNIKASKGHVRDLPTKGLGVDVEHDFKPEYEIPDKAKKTISDLKKDAKDAQIIFLATDPDREGEAIAWHLREVLKKKGTPEFKRVVFHELTRSAVDEAFKHPSDLNLALVDAQQARRILDRLVGYKLSPLLWKKVRYGLSAGRVQSVAVRLVVEKERERDAFKSEEYWTLLGLFSDDKKQTLEAGLAEKDGKKLEIKSKNEADAIEDALKDASFKVSSVEKSERKRNPYPPYKTSTLQQAAANVFGFPAKKTMAAAQKLFEQGLITYHRTDSFNLAPQFINEARNYITKEFGNSYLPGEGVFYKSTTKNAQEAHEAIRPTDLYKLPSNVKQKDDEQKIYS
ncbi:MAG: type I DNA topoisomerase, partial [Patescibacteria group bacterium]